MQQLVFLTSGQLQQALEHLKMCFFLFEVLMIKLLLHVLTQVQGSSQRVT